MQYAAYTVSRGSETGSILLDANRMKRAIDGNTRDRTYIIMRVKETLGIHRGTFVTWNQLEFEDHKIEDVELNCCDYDNCPVCDIGNHHWCRNGCAI